MQDKPNQMIVIVMALLMMIGCASAINAIGAFLLPPRAIAAGR